MRITKNADVRKNEILDIAEVLFNEKGYNVTTVEDILKESGIAKGMPSCISKASREALCGIRQS